MKDAQFPIAKTLTLFILLIAIVFTVQIFLSDRPLTQAVTEVCCRYLDGTFSYISGNECVEEKPSGEIVDEQLCFDYFLSN